MTTPRPPLPALALVLWVAATALPAPAAAEDLPVSDPCLASQQSLEADPPAACRAPTYATWGDERLAALIDEALQNNPRVQEALASWRAELHRLPQVTARPDPMLMVTQFARTPETRVGPQTSLFSVTQPFPGLGKIRLRGESTERSAAVRAEILQTQRVEVIRQVKQAYYDLAYVDRALELSREEEALLEHYERLARNRYAQGLGMQGEAVRLQAEITRTLNRREELRWRRVDAEAALNAVLDRPADGPFVPVTLGAPPVLALGDAAPAAPAPPDVLAAQRRIEFRESQVRLAQRNHWPDFSVGVAWANVLGRRDPGGRISPPPKNGKDVYSVMVGVSLPLFRDKYDAGVREAAERSAAARAAHRTTVNEAARAARTATFRLRTIERQIDLFEDALLPQAEQSLLSAEAAYSTGSVGVLDLLDGERLLIDMRLGLARLQADYLKTLADLERATGSAPGAGGEAPS